MAKFKPTIRLPKKLNLLGEEWEIKLTDEQINNSQTTCGLCEFPKKRITLKNNFDLLILFHELNHAYEFLTTGKSSEVNIPVLFWKQVFEQIYLIKEKNDKRKN